MRGETDREKIERFMSALAERVDGLGRIYFTGGGTAVLYGWRKADPEPSHFFEAIAEVKETVDLNIELASPDDFLPPPGWRERSVFHHATFRGRVYHYDLYAQALAKIERGHRRDLDDVAAMLTRDLITRRAAPRALCRSRGSTDSLSSGGAYRLALRGDGLSHD